MPELTLNSPLQYLKGVGPRKGAALADYGLHTVHDLLGYLPRRYLDRRSIPKISQLRIGETATIIGTVRAHGLLYGRKKRYEVILSDDSEHHITLVWFAGLKFFAKAFKKGQLLAATGTVAFYGGYQIVHPELERLDDVSDRLIHAGRIVPVYPQTAELTSVGLTSRGIRTLTTAILDQLAEPIPDYLPPELLGDVQLPSSEWATRQIHYPDSEDSAERARRRLAFDELLLLQFQVLGNKRYKQQATRKHHYRPPGEMLRQFRAGLPFQFTEGQKKAIKEIFTDLTQPHPMARLLQGDVGCGKTVVAISAALYAVENKFQAALMAPTEILVDQHYRNWEPPLSKLGVRVALLSSVVPPAKRKQIGAACASGEIDLVFGTHALIYEYVQFARLGMVIIDEQHRFGVEQRAQLHAKGENPDLLVMTATPIPRTLALTLYGDLDITTIPDLPPGRLPIRTAWRLAETRDKVWEYLRQEFVKGAQAYLVYPVIEKSENSELTDLTAAFEELTSGPLAGCRVGMVHGRMKPKEREAVLAKFRDKQIDLLMATTVIEVGLDNPGATIMVIEHAERFGLAQLHQLRGRVGRGARQSMVVGIAHEPISEIAGKRLEYFAAHSDGFTIAEADLELRGPGEILGVRQSGLPELRLARLGADNDLLEMARSLAARVIEPNPGDNGLRRLYKYLDTATRSRETVTAGG